MKERPILFSAPMVRAILNGTKTQTRRVAPIRKLDILRSPGDMVTWSVSFMKAVKGVLGSHSGGKFTDLQARSIIASKYNPYGQPGDRLWVRETYFRDEEDGAILYAANPDDFEVVHHNKVETGSPRYNWKPSIFMPRWASRITLEITAVRVERLQDISEKDAWAEGCEGFDDDVTGGKSGYTEFAELWESINGPGSWEANPWVWAIEFKRVMS